MCTVRDQWKERTEPFFRGGGYRELPPREVGTFSVGVVTAWLQ